MEGCYFDTVENVKYLGTTYSGKGGMEMERKARLVQNIGGCYMLKDYYTHH